jgi:hypothetical protein
MHDPVRGNRISCHGLKLNPIGMGKREQQEVRSHAAPARKPWSRTTAALQQ